MRQDSDRGFVARIFEDAPLMRFSLYTHTQFESLCRTRSRLSSICPRPNDIGAVNYSELLDYHDLFWLWTLGAYEVLRTMTQHSSCFREEAQERLQKAKVEVATLRMPFAKQELRGQTPKGKNRFSSENSFSAIDNGLVFIVNEERIQSEDFMDRTIEVLRSIKIDDIISSMPIAKT